MEPKQYIFKDLWLSEVLNKPTYRIELSGVTDLEAARSAVAEPGSFFFTRVDVTDIEGVRIAEALGFHLVDTNVQFSKGLGSSKQPDWNSSSCEIRFSTADDESDVAALAHQAFTQTRFHKDENISRNMANKIKEEWVRNFYRGKRGEWMVVAAEGATILGFLQIIRSKSGEMVIDLIAVDEKARGKGIAKNMIAFAEANIEGMSTFHVGTQLANFGSIQCYRSCGFEFSSAKYIYHRHG